MAAFSPTRRPRFGVRLMQSLHRCRSPLALAMSTAAAHTVWNLCPWLSLLPWPRAAYAHHVAVSLLKRI